MGNDYSHYFYFTTTHLVHGGLAGVYPHCLGWVGAGAALQLSQAEVLRGRAHVHLPLVQRLPEDVLQDPLVSVPAADVKALPDCCVTWRAAAAG